jgi:hypothetical protein
MFKRKRPSAGVWLLQAWSSNAREPVGKLVPCIRGRTGIPELAPTVAECEVRRELGPHAS